ncbi:molecular chaperone [Pseudomonas sp. NA-150]|uniref:fimbrial biogenesis chaperone n=1 Tax=Pseudomonas sp. NA-150 TaxID=3367525 RepID=UPI0037C5AB2D
MVLHTLFRFACVWLAMALAVNAHAGIVLNTTRIIYPASDKEVSFGVHNSGGGEILLQSWLESASGEAADLPFAVTPGLARMQGDAKQLLRILYAGSEMPHDRESVFWLNVQEIPQAAGENALQIAIRQRIKVFFRPQGLKEEPAEAPEALQWRLLQSDVVQVSNPGPYHVSMVGIEVKEGVAQMMKMDSQMLAPKQTMSLTLNKPSTGRPLDLTFTSINDFGGQVPYRASLTLHDISNAVRVAKTQGTRQ